MNPECSLRHVCALLGAARQALALPAWVHPRLALSRLQREPGSPPLLVVATGIRHWRVVDARPTADGVMVAGMTAQPLIPDPGEPYQVIQLGGQAAAIVPLADLRRLQAVGRLAPAEVVESAEIETTLAAHREWVAAGRPGAVSHEQAMAELLAEP